MSKDQFATNPPAPMHAGPSNDASNNSPPPRLGPYRSISAKRPRDPSHRKSVSFNDVPIVYEVPSYDIMRCSNADVYRSWLYTDATTPSPIVPSLYSTQTISPLNSTSVTAQKLHANRLSSALYGTSSTMVTPNRMPDWALRTRGYKLTPTSTSATEEPNVTNENSPPTVPPVDDKTPKDTALKSSNPLPYTHPYMIHSTQPVLAPAAVTAPTSSTTSESHEEKKYGYRAPIIPETEHVRASSLSNGSPASTTPTYASILASNLTSSSTDQSTYPNSRLLRARSAITPSAAATQASIRTNEPISIAPFRTVGANMPFSTSAVTPTARTVLRPSTVAFQCPPPTTAATATTATPLYASSPALLANTNPSSYTPVVPAATTLTNPTSSSTPVTAARAPTAAPRYNPTATTPTFANSRILLPQNRTLTSAALSAAAMRYTLSHSPSDTALANGIISQSTPARPPPTAYPRSRSANVLNMRRASTAHVSTADGQAHGGAATDANSNLYSTMRRSPNVRQNYGSYLMQRLLVHPTTN